MTIYENIKAAISVKQAAEHYGLKVNRSGMTCCPFHNDRHPSLKLNEDYFFCFGWIEIYQSQEQFFAETLKTVPTVLFLALPGVAGLNAAEHLRSLYPKCGIIWCSDLDFSLHAFRLRIEYFFMKPVEEQKIKEGLSIWFECNKIR